MAKNLLHPYRYQKESEDTYVFYTDNNLEYVVFFEKEIQSYFLYNQPGIAEKFFEFGFVPINIKLSEVNQYPYDERIILTVVQILNDYFEQNQNAIIYNCLTSDGRQEIRARYFNNIFQKIRQNDILKFNSIIDVENDVQYYQSLLIRKDNADLEELVEAFYSISNIFE